MPVELSAWLQVVGTSKPHKDGKGERQKRPRSFALCFLQLGFGRRGNLPNFVSKMSREAVRGTGASGAEICLRKGGFAAPLRS